MTKPEILRTQQIASTRIFKIEEVDLRFSNGEHRTFERIQAHHHGVVLIIPMLDQETFLLVREYACGLESYQLSLPTGFIHADEPSLAAANREIREEIGYRADNLTELAVLSSSPGYSRGKMHVVLASELTPDKIEGDEPEALEVVPWSIKKIPELLAQDDFSHTSSLAALYLAKEQLNSNKSL